MEAEAQEAIFVWWINPGSDETVRLRIAFEECIEFVDGIR